MRLRSSEGSACFLLSDCADADAGNLVRDPRHLQLVGGDSAPLVLDVDSLHPNGAQALRIKNGRQLLQVMFRTTLCGLWDQPEALWSSLNYPLQPLGSA